MSVVIDGDVDNCGEISQSATKVSASSVTAATTDDTHLSLLSSLCRPHSSGCGYRRLSCAGPSACILNSSCGLHAKYLRTSDTRSSDRSYTGPRRNRGWRRQRYNGDMRLKQRSQGVNNMAAPVCIMGITLTTVL